MSRKKYKIEKKKKEIIYSSFLILICNWFLLFHNKKPRIFYIKLLKKVLKPLVGKFQRPIRLREIRNFRN